MIVLVLLLHDLWLVDSIDPLQSEYLALYDLYNSTNGKHWKWSTSSHAGIHWLFNGNSNPCTDHWQGVNCTVTAAPPSTYHVAKLQLPSMKLTGSLPATIGNFTHLWYLDLNTNSINGNIPESVGTLSDCQFLDLHDNKIVGTIPPSIGNLAQLQYLHLEINDLKGIVPESIGNLQKLQKLYLRSNKLAGALPASMGNLSSLQYLVLDTNKFDKPLPDTLGQLTALQHVDLNNNHFTGPLPASMGDLINLQYLDLHVNDFSGSLPSWIGNLIELKYLDMSSDHLKGHIPDTLGSLVKVTTLYLHNNFLAGTIPDSVGNLRSLTDLQFNSNYLVGSIPPSIGNLTQLQHLKLCTNFLTGALPNSIGNLRKLIELDVHGNQLEGSIPASIGNLVKLQKLYLFDNALVGSLPESVGNLVKLQLFEAHINQLDGRIPASLGNLVVLQNLNLYNNALSGPLPGSLGNLTRLQYLYLYDNRLTGSIPHSIGRLTRLQYLNLESNQLTGQIPRSVGNLSALTLIDLNTNRLSGSIPATLGNLTRLQTISLYNNHLSGALPPSIGGIGVLANLRLNSNRLSGAIPPSLGALAKLQLLYLHDNALTGSIPDAVGLLDALQYLVLQRNELTGPVPGSIGNMTALQYLDVDTNCLTGTIPESLAAAQSLLEIDLYDNYLQGAIPPALCSRSTLLGIGFDQNMLSGALPANLSVGLTYLYVSDNMLTGTLPQVLQNMTALVILGLANNMFTGQITDIFSPQQTELVNVHLEGNQFTGELPSVLFELPALISLSVVGSCLHGTLPSNVCNATQLEALILYGLTTGASCRSRGVQSLSLSQQTFGGTFPSCLLGLPNLLTLLVASNGLTGSIAREVTVGAKLLELDLSHNQLTGIIPAAVQNHTWLLLDLSHNKLEGVLQDDLLRTVNVSQLNTTALHNVSVSAYGCTLSLSSNRLSGPVPNSVMPLHNNLSVLAGNLFDCRYDKSDLPQHDSNLDTYTCASNTFNISIFVWLGLFVAMVGVMVAIYQYRLNVSREGTASLLMTAAQLPNALLSQLPHVHILLGEFHVLHRTAWYCTAFCVVLLLPYYAIMSMYQGTHTHQYAYALSAIYVTGVAPFAVDVVLLTLLLCALYLYFALKSSKVAGDGAGAAEARSRFGWRRACVVGTFAACNIVMVLAANVAFVYTVLYQSSEVQTLAQVLLSFFKIVWSSFVAPTMIRELAAHVLPPSDGPAPTFFMLQLLVALFNNIAIPCLVVAAIDPNCFSNILLPPATETVYYLNPTCVSATRGQPCQSVVYDRSSLQFTPPFTYSYQCSASFITSYAPTFIYMSISTALLSPLLQYVLLRLHERLPAGSIAHRIVSEMVPTIVKPPAPYVSTAAEPGRCTDPLFGAVGALVTAFTQLGILLTFGVMFPPVALAMAVSLSVFVYLTRWKVLRFLHAAAEAQQLSYFTIIDAECEATRGGEQFLQAVKILVCFCCAFYALFLFDTLGDAVGFAASVWVIILVPLAPCVLFGVLYLYHRLKLSEKNEKSCERKSIELTVAVEGKEKSGAQEECVNVLHVSNV